MFPQPQIWLCPTDRPLIPGYQALLSSEEMARGERYQRPQDKQRFLTMRLALRILLARHLNCLPQQLQFTYGPQGKPELVSRELRSPWFNVAHSSNYGLIGLSTEGEIGVDLQIMVPKAHGLKLARRFFSLQETEQLENLPPEERIKLFYQLWTAKEAFLKATGQGISGGLHQVMPSKNLDQYQCLPSNYETKQWQLSSQRLFGNQADQTVNDNYWTAIAWRTNPVNRLPSSPWPTIEPFSWPRNLDSFL
ncbi:4'-phosphopantetheinyl transferase superfamily protein [Synechocystis sp. PCC 7339]|uniref:4'-phosphopantetheinyl transferase family protein n=1 Tax=unclassified Synechocystis TaxID=2640012 RepID=UPI001BAF0E29|nr:MULTISPECIES: 4'-phosphopantetheinyl transferase superfamily protein [unclassified Synechocystis]QUS60114.1 4'-phosphopantetheinyl transferase superfamily protein [Synechocystis sp. PCC 7338]UAJ72438.1 4'-phosphopantetheinyl transferase superfamily protein [Synechocystis sp. PCC 7339]